MRALAVLIVLLFHLDVPGFAGGYLGVDLFFVISGFIITRNILADIHDGGFSIREFYVRRFRRLYPALLVTVLLTVVVAIVALPPVELMNTARSAIFALLSLANFSFWLEAGYFDAAANTKPLLHTWSLSVEEQYYLFWPALVLLLANTARRAAVTGMLLLLSLCATLLWRNSFADGVFFLLPFRLHQLMAGALIALFAARLASSTAQASLLLGSAGFLVVSTSLSDIFSPALGAVAVTLFGALLLLGREAPIARWLYANTPMQWIGRRSYAIYLVHWPIIVLFMFSTGFQLNSGSRVLLFALSIIAAIALHELVEKPFRKRGIDSTRLQRIASPLAVATLLVTLFLSASVWRLDGFPSRVDHRIREIVASVDREMAQRRRAVNFGTCNLHREHKFSNYDAQACATPDPDRRNVLILGDSMAADTYMMLSQAYPEIRFSQATAGACTPVVRLEDIGGKYPTCEALNEYRFTELVERDMDLVVLASIWTEDRIAPLKETVDYLHARGKKVLVMGPRAHFAGAIPLLISRESSLDGVDGRLQERVIRDGDLLQRMREALPNVTIVDIATIQCDPVCSVVEGDRLLYTDERHFTELGARKIGERSRKSFDLLKFMDAQSAAASLTTSPGGS